jgi:transglutaminase-like putative cysteine protease
METGDPFGIYKVSIDYPDSVNMMVVPPVMPLPEIEVASGISDGQDRSLIKAMSQTVTSTSVREYAPGDSIRWLHWPTTARTGNPFVRVFEDEPTSDWWVLLDLDSRVQAGKGQKSTEEHGVILAASLVNRGLELGKKVGLVSHGDLLAWHPPDRGETHLWTILSSLAKIRVRGRSLAHLLIRIRASLRGRTSLIIITSSLSSDWVDYLELMIRSGIVPTVLLLDPVSFGGSGDVDFIRERLNKLGVRHHLITSDLLDRPENRQKDGFDWLLHHPRRSGQAIDRWEIAWLKFSKNLRVWGLVLLFFWGMVRAMGNAVRGLEGNLLWGMIAGSIGASLLLERSRLRGWVVALLQMVMGWIAITIRVGQLGEPIRDAITRILDLVPQITSWIFRSTQAPHYELFTLSLNEIWVGIIAVGFRLLGWLLDLLKGQPFYDPVVIAFVWGIAVWGVAAWAVWGIIRYRKPLAGMLPSMVLVGLSLALIRNPSNNLALMFGVTSALMVFIQYDFRESQWEAKQLSYTSSIRSKISTAAILLAIGLMVVSMITPTVSIESFAEIIRNLSDKSNKAQELTSSLGLEAQYDSKDVYILDLRRAGGLPNSHLIGSGSELSEQVVMVLRIDSYLSGDQEIDVTSQTPLYLRSLIYDKYTGRGWTSRETQVLDYQPGEQVPTRNLENAYQIRQQIQFIEDMSGILYTFGDLQSVDQEFQVAWRIQDAETGIYDFFGATVDAETYRADSIVPVYSEMELRSAGQNYPDWVLERYMELPTSVPETVHTLARDLTATELTPFDRAVAIESYLREIPYSLDVELGPDDQDIVEYFLFDSQLGYCDYYATSMVVLSRAAGFPARYVMGYVVENYDQEEDLFIITADQAHAWVEVYFPGYGWIPFEPTGGRSGIDRQEEPSPELPADFSFELSPLVPIERGFSLNNTPWLLFISAFLLSTVLIYWGLSNWWMARISIATLVPKLYRRMYRYGRWVGLIPKPGDTVYLYSDKLSRLFLQASQGSHWAGWIRQSSALITQFTHALVIILFAPSSERGVSRDQVIKIYKQLLPRFWLLWLMVRVYRFPILRSLFWNDASQFVKVMVARIPR